MLWAVSQAAPLRRVIVPWPKLWHGTSMKILFVEPHETLDWSWFARTASCVFNLLQESPWRFDSFRYFWIFLMGCVLFPCQVDHNLFLWYLRLPPAGVSSKDARHSLPALLAFMSPAIAFIPRNRDMLRWCESFPRGCEIQNVSTRLTIQQCYAGIPSKE